MSVKEIEIAITQLPATELAELMAWLENYYAQMWDRQIEEDLEAGRLDALLAEVDKEYEAGLGQQVSCGSGLAHMLSITSCCRDRSTAG